MFKFLFGVLLIGIGFLKAIFQDPIWGLYLFAALSHIPLSQLGENIGLPLRIPIVIACLTLFLYIINPNYKKKFSKWPAEVWLFGVMVIGMCFGSQMAKFDHDLSWMLTFDYFKYWIFFILFIQMVDSIKKVDWFYWIMFLSAVWLVYRCWDLRGTTGPRFENMGGGNISDANHFAAALVLLFPFVFYRTFSQNKLIALGAAILCFGVIMAIFISVSRGGLLGMLALIIFMILAFREQRKKILAFIVIIGISSAPFITESQLERLATLQQATSQEQRDASAQSRVDFWRLAFQLFKENPLFGVGPGNFMYYSGFMVERQPYGVPGHVTHSLWFEILSQGGLMMAIPFSIMLFRFFRNSIRLARHYKANGQHESAICVQIPLIGLGAFLVCATFLDRLVYEPIYWCLGLGTIHKYLFENPSRKEPTR